MHSRHINVWVRQCPCGKLKAVCGPEWTHRELADHALTQARFPRPDYRVVVTMREARA
jgi:hypothetical protein